MSALTPSELPALTWEHGILWPMLNRDQMHVYWQYRTSQALLFILDCARRWGKSTLMLVAAHEDAIRRPGARIPYGAQTTKEVKEVLRPMCEGWLWHTCPDPALKPEWRSSEGDILFPNGSRIVIVGVDVAPDRLRGPAMDSGYGDEIAFWDDAEYVIESILKPQMQGRPHAKLLLGSTPPKTPAHPWSIRYVPRGKAQKAYAHRTILDNPLLSDAEKEFWIGEAGGRSSTTCRRELFAEHVVDETAAVVPEFREAKDKIVREVPRPKWFHAYVSLDPGWTHHTAGLFGYWHFDLAALVIEDDFSMPRANSRTIADIIKEKEKALWEGCPYFTSSDKPPKPQPYLRVSDTDMRLIADLHTEHGLVFAPTAKDDRDAQINALRLHIQQERILIHPRCTNLIAHLEFGIWNRQRTQFLETAEFGHFDCLAAAIYLDRNIARSRNPYPPRHHGLSRDDTFIPPHTAERGRGWEKLRKKLRSKWSPTR